METAVSKRGQTVIPAAIRRRYNITGGSRLVWLDDGQTIRVVPVPEDPLKSLRGRARGSGITRQLLAERRADREREGS
jgi:AbrB family looped-hinge helix DNA binding protein